MSSSSTQRSKRFREKLKEDEEKLEVYKRKDRERKKREYLKKKHTLAESEKLRIRKKKTLRQRQWRASKKNKDKAHHNQVKKDATTAGSFKSPQSLGKAVRKVNKSLPKSPSKAHHVIANVVQQMSPRKRKSVLEICDQLVKKRKSEVEKRKKRSDAISDKDTRSIEEFYMRDDISRMCPGRKDFVTVRSKEGKEHKQKRLLIYNISEVYEIFKAEIPSIQVSLSKFASLRPPNVLPITPRDQEVCVCKYHENIKLLLDGLKAVIPEVPKTPEDMLLTTVCNMEDVECIDRECSKCQVHQPIEKLFQCDDNTPMFYFQWNIGDDGKARKERVECTAADAKDDLKAQLQPFARHVYNVKRQFNELKYLKENLPEGEIIIQEDFSENFQIKYQQEIMAAHWSNDSVTIFPAVVYYKDKRGDLQHNSYAVVSDEMAHDKGSVYAFNKAILKDIKKVTKVRKVNYWSDGPSSQFKNRYNLSCILYHQEDFGCEATWSFFETAHGKGPCDGVGAEVKRAVWRSILRGTEVVNTPHDFFQAAQNVSKNINILYVSQEDVKGESDNLKERWDECKPIPKTHTIHYAAKLSDSSFITAKNSQFLIKDGEQNDTLVAKATTHPKSVPQQSSKQGRKKSNSVNIEMGLPPHLTLKFENISQYFTLPMHTMYMVNGILDGKVKWKGKGIISPSDLDSLNGGYAKAEFNYLTNFVVDSYLELLKANRNMTDVTVFPWEIFKTFITKKLLSEKALLQQDIILVPCNTAETEHWFLLAVFPQEKLMAVLDSLACAFVKSTAQAAIQRMWRLLQMMDSSLDVSQWSFVANKACNIPQQSNSFDCGVFVSLYARCLVENDIMLGQPDIQKFRKHMVAELHKQTLLTTTPNIEVGMYYAVDYVNVFYIGRALETSGQFTSFKFLHSSGAKKFNWPKSDDLEEKHITCIFYGPIKLTGNGPFTVDDLEEIEAIFKTYIVKKGR